MQPFSCLNPDTEIKFYIYFYDFETEQNKSNIM